MENSPTWQTVGGVEMSVFRGEFVEKNERDNLKAAGGVEDCSCQISWGKTDNKSNWETTRHHLNFRHSCFRI